MNALDGLNLISQHAGVRVDYTQGGGGNTSAKLDDNRMAVKASGFQLKQITQKTGFVVVDYKNIKKYYEGVDLSVEADYEKESGAMMSENILDFEDLPRLRPSVEAGFHSLLYRYVIHVHSVYVNILMCSVEGKALVDELFAGKPYSYVFIPYVDPGFTLTCHINEASKKLGKTPDVIFMENHGLVVTHDDAEQCAKLVDDVNDTIRAHFNLTGEAFPEIVMEETADGFVSKTAYINSYIRENKVTAKLFSDIILYPDQLVYLNGSADKMIIDENSGSVTYKYGEKEARSVEETLLAYLYIVDKINALGLTVQTMGAGGIDFINNWESEKYRRAMSK